MKARDVMTTDVAMANPDTPTRDIAALLLRRGISAVPIVDAGGAPIGMVSEGDLVGRDENAREARRDWWLALLAEGNPLHEDFLASLRTPERRAREIMSAPVVTVEEDTPVAEIARLLAALSHQACPGGARWPHRRHRQPRRSVARSRRRSSRNAARPEAPSPGTTSFRGSIIIFITVAARRPISRRSNRPERRAARDCGSTTSAPLSQISHIIRHSIRMLSAVLSPNSVASKPRS